MSEPLNDFDRVGVWVLVFFVGVCGLGAIAGAVGEAVNPSAGLAVLGIGFLLTAIFVYRRWLR